MVDFSEVAFYGRDAVGFPLAFPMLEFGDSEEGVEFILDTEEKGSKPNWVQVDTGGLAQAGGTGGQYN